MEKIGDILFHIFAIVGSFNIVFWLMRFLPRLYIFTKKNNTLE